MTITLPPTALDDHDRVADYLRIRGSDRLHHRGAPLQPSTDAIAAAVGLSPVQLTRLFARFAGITPKQFLAAITLDAAKRLLEDAASVLDTALEVGLSGPGRLHDLFFVTHEAMTPGAFKARGAGLVMRHGSTPRPSASR